MYDHKVYNGSYVEPYTNPGAPVHITSGSAVSSQFELLCYLKKKCVNDYVFLGLSRKN